ncbi:hypothetical protein CCACVL1_25830 [Corchorus capsularis]|uniref:Uncharacterized protein n=1 Tax=Corchorus capsularis TaxID=210143 RepID=A0A1R3GGZ2_COCAP|nr:hypothetical protein CCACVL1_25830 [Corchorus capsularis]
MELQLQHTAGEEIAQLALSTLQRGR